MPRIVFSFDTEDFVSPHSDDMAKSLAETLARNGLRGSFCMVASRARALVERGRTDVLDELPAGASHPGLDKLQFKKRWSIFPEDFEGAELVKLARLQSWTFKPAREEQS